MLRRAISSSTGAEDLIDDVANRTTSSMPKLQGVTADTTLLCQGPPFEVQKVMSPPTIIPTTFFDDLPDYMADWAKELGVSTDTSFEGSLSCRDKFSQALAAFVTIF